jgi:predicted P-loop ATPase
MQSRLKKVERVLAVQEQLHRLAQWRMAALEREKTENANGQADLLSALNDDSRLQGLFVEAMTKRLAVLAREAERLERARRVMEQQLSEEGLKLKRTEKMTDRVRREHQRGHDKQLFQDLLETLAKARDASLP